MSHLSAQPEHSRRKRPQRLIGIHQPLEKPPLLQPIPVPTQHPPRNLIRIPVPLTDIIHDGVTRRPHPSRVQVRLVANLQRDEVAPQRLYDEPAHLDGVVERRRGVEAQVGLEVPQRAGEVGEALEPGGPDEDFCGDAVLGLFGEDDGLWLGGVVYYAVALGGPCKSARG